jgi:Spy/CpxP family protein refolding chaperone
MRTKAKALREAMQAGSTDATAVGKQMIELRDLRKQIQANRAKAGEQAVSYLSAEQKTKLAALKESAELRREARAAMALGLLPPPAGEGRGMGKQIPMRGFRGGRH